jgi:integrase
MASIIKREGKRGVTYKVVIRRKGFDTITRNFPTRKTAKDWARDTEGNHDRMTRLGGSGSRLTLADVIDKYMLAYRGRDKSVPQKCALWKERLGIWKLTEITRQVIAEELDRLKVEPALQPLRGNESKDASRTRSEATVNRYHATLSAVFKFAIGKGFADGNPAKGIPRGGETSRFGRALDDDERERLLQAARKSSWPQMHLFCLMALSTGGRLGELMGLRWSDIDLQKRLARLRKTKNNDIRLLPLIPAVVEGIKTLPTPINRDFYLFPSEASQEKNYYGSFHQRWHEVLKEAEITDFRAHDMRHTAASMLISAGIPTATVASLLGHRDLQVTMRYIHNDTQGNAAVIDKVFGEMG